MVVCSSLNQWVVFPSLSSNSFNKLLASKEIEIFMIKVKIGFNEQVAYDFGILCISYQTQTEFMVVSIFCVKSVKDFRFMVVVLCF